jgi:PhnB protein
MENLILPTGYQQVMPYLILTGAERFLAFMQNVFGATEKYKAMRDETHIMHAELQVGESTIMYASSTG